MDCICADRGGQAGVPGCLHTVVTWAPRGGLSARALPQRWSAPVGVSSNTGWRCASAVKSAAGESLLALK